MFDRVIEQRFIIEYRLNVFIQYVYQAFDKTLLNLTRCNLKKRGECVWWQISATIYFGSHRETYK